MPTTEQLRDRLIDKLKELFQLDQPDLDFGFYRIMHAKAEQVQEFIDKDLLKIVENAFGQADETRKEKLQAKIEREIQAAREYGVTDPENSPKVKEAQAEYNAVKDSAGSEADIYDHLYRFFERYYDAGDFISRRYYTRETAGKAAPFAVPYNGEEVKLHWANADQYYIKTAEYFTNFTFDLVQSAEVRKMTDHERVLNMIPEKLHPVHFRIADADEGEHGNVKATDANKRFFIIHGQKPVEVSEDGELVVNFEYRADPEKSGQENTWRDKRNAQAVETILGQLETMIQENDGHREALVEYLRLLKIPAPTEKDKKRPVLAKYINQYTARNTMDYFIHKDLGGFLRRELDFYIKNEVMRLDDIENADVPAVESYLTKIKILRKISHKIIDFLAQLEDFQKKLWLKKKFVVETNYCITLGRVPEELYPEIADNEAQRKEWVKLFAIDEIKGDLHSRKYSKPLTVKFLKENPFLVVDTRFFDEEFKERLIASVDDLDEECDGLLIHSENFQALNLLQERYREQVKCVYIDPPYNTAASEILYKNEYKHSSWCTLMHDRMKSSRMLISQNGIIQIAIDDAEFHRLEGVTRLIFNDDNYISNIAIMHNPKGRDQKHIADCHEYTILAAKDIRHAETYRLRLTEKKLSKKYSKEGENGRHRELPLRRSGSGAQREDRPYMYYPFLCRKDDLSLSLIPKKEYTKIYDGTKFNDDFIETLASKYKKEGYYFILPIRDNGSKGRWRWGYDSAERGCSSRVLFAKINKTPTIYQIDEADDTYLPKSLWYGERFDASTKGTNLLKDIVPSSGFDYPKSIFAVKDMIVIGSDESGIVLDYFAGSGTTAHAVINLNREDNGHRKYILVEMGDYFDTVLKPRIQKVIYSESWKNGKPTARGTGVSHCFKYLRLESYEDTLNNLSFNNNSKAYQSNPNLYEDYMLRYMLDVETQGSQSLLNIDTFADPCAYKLKVKQPGSDEYVVKNVDLLETFNYLIGLRVVHIAASLSFTAKFKREPDPELPENQQTRLIVDGRIKQDKNGPWWFRKVEGWVPMDAANPNNGQRKKVLIVWRKLTGNLEKDNLMLDEWFQKNRISTRDFEFDTIYVNGSNNLPNLKLDHENWKVRLIEEEFMKRMWDVEGV